MSEQPKGKVTEEASHMKSNASASKVPMAEDSASWGANSPRKLCDTHSATIVFQLYVLCTMRDFDLVIKHAGVFDDVKKHVYSSLVPFLRKEQCGTQ